MDYFLELAIGTVITIITYFLKKTMDKIDKTDYKIQQIEKDYLTEVAHEKIIKEVKKDIQRIGQRIQKRFKRSTKTVLNERRLYS